MKLRVRPEEKGAPETEFLERGLFGLKPVLSVFEYRPPGGGLFIRGHTSPDRWTPPQPTDVKFACACCDFKFVGTPEEGSAAMKRHRAKEHVGELPVHGPLSPFPLNVWGVGYRLTA